MLSIQESKMLFYLNNRGDIDHRCQIYQEYQGQQIYRGLPKKIKDIRDIKDNDDSMKIKDIKDIKDIQNIDDISWRWTYQ